MIKFAAAVSIVAAIPVLLSCEGRRADNMVPTGDTIEVQIRQIEPDMLPLSPSDTIKEIKENQNQTNS